MTPARKRKRRLAAGTFSTRRASAATIVTGVAIGVASFATPAAGEPTSGTLTWSVNPSSTSADSAFDSASMSATPAGFRLDTKQRHPASSPAPNPNGMRQFTPRVLHTPVGSVSASMDATIPAGTGVTVDVRGLRGDGTWSEWQESTPDTPAVFAERTRTVQTRVVLSAPRHSESPQVRRVDFTADRDVSPSATQPTHTTAQHTVFATREGLVGQTTANGHVITERDHFVALPSRKALADKDSDDYSVRVCTTDGARCEWAPVWDVGPWNTEDDYWNADRAKWPDLPRGTPQAQAAYQDGHNGGKDQFGRQVGNPAGIDLADGTFWDGLALSDNDWVTVTYQWVRSQSAGTVHADAPALDVRSAPRSSAEQVGLAADNARVAIDCATRGDSVRGSQRTSSEWLKIADGKYIPRASVRTEQAPSVC